jgi:hypothetical protein
MTDITAAIAALTGQDALRIRADVADCQAPLPDPAQLRALDTGLRQAITSDPALIGHAQPGAPADPGGLARAALQHLAATRPDLIPVITHAIEFPGPALRDPVTLTVGAVVLLALQTEIKLTRDTRGHWTLTMHKHPVRDSTLGQC